MLLNVMCGEYSKRAEGLTRAAREPYTEEEPCARCGRVYAKWKIYKGPDFHVSAFFIILPLASIISLEIIWRIFKKTTKTSKNNN